MQSLLRWLSAVSLLCWCTVCQAQSFINFESGQVRPLILSPSGRFLFALNTPDNRLEVFRPKKDGLEHVSGVFVGLEPVSVEARSDSEVFVVNHLSDSVSVVDLSDPLHPFVRDTLLVGDEPRDLVLAGPGYDKIFVTTARRGQNRPADPQLTTPGVGRADVWVFDARDLARAPVIITLFCDTPRGLAVSPDGTRVYVAAFHSGNRTTILREEAVNAAPEVNAQFADGFQAPGRPPLPPELPNTTGEAPPETGLIVRYDGGRWVDSADRDWTPRVRLTLPDKDVFVLDARQDPPVEVAYATGVGTILFNLAVHPLDGRVFVTNLESRNQVPFEPALRGHVVENRVTVIDFNPASPAVEPVHLNPHIDDIAPFGSPEEVAKSLAQPQAMAFSARGDDLYVAAFGSGKVGVLDSTGRVLRSIPVGGGPSGLALDESRGRLYVLDRFAQRIVLIDLASETVVGSCALGYDAEPPAVRRGRRFLYDATISSGHGDASCGSCHIFGDFDSLAWDLGDPTGVVEENPLRAIIDAGLPALRPFHPMKGPMTTQSLRGMAGAGAMHWRGDRNSGQLDGGDDESASFLAFRPAFQSLLGRESPFPEADMEAFRDFILTVQYPPNPVARLDGDLTLEQALGEQIFIAADRDGFGGSGVRCNFCHRGIGTRGGGAYQPTLAQDFKVPHLRNLYQKIGMFGDPQPRIVESPLRLEEAPTPHAGDQVRGFGFRHDGGFPTLFSLFRKVAHVQLEVPFEPFGGIARGDPVEVFRFRDDAQFSGDEKARGVEAFLLAFDTGLAPLVGAQFTARAARLTELRPRLELFREQAVRGRVDLVVHGVVAGEPRGYVLLRAEEEYQSDQAGERLREEQLLTLVEHGAVLTWTAVYPGGGVRMGIDRDQDGVWDGDERRMASDPANPDDVPREFRRGDCDADGSLQISDVVFLLDFLFRDGSSPRCLRACDAAVEDGRPEPRVNVADAISLLSFLLRGGPAPGPDCEVAGGCAVSTCAG